MLILLGIRSVARRGVTLSSIAGTYTIGAQLAIPFNLQLLNLAAHSRDQEDEGKGLRPWELLGDKIKNGYGELADLPRYLDLPAYESVRELGVESSAYRPVRYDEKVLVLCPFSPEYHGPELEALPRNRASGKVDVAATKNRPRRRESSAPRAVARPQDASPRLTDAIRSDSPSRHVRHRLDRTSSQRHVRSRGSTGDESARRRSHLLSRRSPAASGCEAISRTWPRSRSCSRRSHTVARSAIRCRTEEMITCFETSLAASNSGRPGFAYTAVGTALDRRSHPAALSLVDELTRAANILTSDDEESTGISPVLYHEVNKELVAEAYEAAAERRLAAWLFLTRRYSPEEIASDAQRLHHFELLTAQTRRWARKQGRQDIIDEIAEQQRAVKLVKRQIDQ